MDTKIQLRKNYLAIRMFHNVEQEGIENQRKIKEQFEKSQMKHAMSMYEKKLHAYKMRHLASQMKQIEIDQSSPSNMTTKKRKRPKEITYTKEHKTDCKILTSASKTSDGIETLLGHDFKEKKTIKTIFHNNDMNDLVSNFCSKLKSKSQPQPERNTTYRRHNNDLDAFILSQTGIDKGEAIKKDHVDVHKDLTTDYNVGTKLRRSVRKRRDTNNQEPKVLNIPHSAETSDYSHSIKTGSTIGHSDTSNIVSHDDSGISTSSSNMSNATHTGESEQMERPITKHSSKMENIVPSTRPHVITQSDKSNGITLNDIIGETPGKDLSGVKIKQCWIGDPEAINSIRRPIPSRHEKLLKQLVQRAMVRKQGHLTDTTGGFGMTGHHKKPAKDTPNGYTPPYPVSFPEDSQNNRNHTLHNQEVGKDRKGGTGTVLPIENPHTFVKKRPSSAPVVNGITPGHAEFSNQIDLTENFQLDISDALHNKRMMIENKRTLKSRYQRISKSYTPNSKVWCVLNPTEIGQSNVTKTENTCLSNENIVSTETTQTMSRLKIRNKSLRRSLTQPTFSSLQKMKTDTVKHEVTQTTPSVKRSHSVVTRRVSSAAVRHLPRKIAPNKQDVTIDIPFAIDEEVSLV